MSAGGGAGGRIAASLIAVAAGSFIVAVALDVIHAPPESFHAPRWVVALAGASFVLAGLILLAGEHYPLLRRFVLAVFMVVFAAPFNWVAFGPGPREFSGGAGVGPVAVGGRVNETAGRIAFGVGAVLIDVIALVVWVSLFRFLLRPSRRDGMNEG